METLESSHPETAPLPTFDQDSKMKGRRKMFQCNLSKSMPTMRSEAELLADDDHIMALRFARRCDRTEDDTSPLPAPTRFRKLQPNLFSGALTSHRIVRSLSHPNLGTDRAGGYQLERFSEKSDEIIVKALRMVLYLNFYFFCLPNLLSKFNVSRLRRVTWFLKTILKANPAPTPLHFRNSATPYPYPSLVVFPIAN
jgi:hypothetical protein